MPELPEVETVVRDLRPLIVGRTIDAISFGANHLRRPWDASWSPQIVGQRIDSIIRRGKWMRMPLSNNGVLLWHLGMTGQMTVVPESSPISDHTHIRLTLSGDTDELRFRDIRRFGSVDWFATAADLDTFLADRLGPEPFDLTTTQLLTSLQHTIRPIKAVLLDQLVVAGVGNIYADEALFLANLPPTQSGRVTTADEAERLRAAIVTVISQAIEGRGSTIRNYVGGSGLAGTFQAEHHVYGRTNEPCTVCATAILCTRIAGRSSHYCPQCQPTSTAVSLDFQSPPIVRTRRGK